MSNIKSYLTDVYQEMMNKVTWPTWTELQGSAIVVMIASVLISLVVYAMDISFSTLLEKLYGV